MKRWQRQVGEGRVGCIFWTLLLAFGVMAAVKFVPVKIATVELKDHMRSAAQSMPRGTEKQFVDSIVKRAVELGLPVTRKDVTVKKWTERVRMNVEFVVPIDLLITTYNWKVKLVVDRQIFLI